MSIKVKALEWCDGGFGYIGGKTEIADTIVGKYIVEQCSDWCVYLNGQFQSQNHLDEVTAKAAAQADYERRIISTPEASLP